MQKLKLEKLGSGLPGITPNYGGTLAESASVCLEDQGHNSGVTLKVSGSCEESFGLFWESVTDQMRRCYNDHEVATEKGAYGIAILLILKLTDYTVIDRSRKGTGYDYCLGKEGEENDSLIFNDKVRLEVSGIRKGNNSEIKKRVKKK